jgi:hypothetical protein
MSSMMKLRTGDLELFTGHIDFDHKQIDKTTTLTTACKESALDKLTLRSCRSSAIASRRVQTTDVAVSKTTPNAFS